MGYRTPFQIHLLSVISPELSFTIRHDNYRMTNSGRLTFLTVIFLLFGCSLISETQRGIRAIYFDNNAGGPQIHTYATHGNLSSLPTSVLFKTGELSSAGSFQEWAATNLDVSLAPIVRLTENQSESHVKYQQMYEDIPIEGAVYTAHFEDGLVWSVTGQVYDDIDVDTQADLSAGETSNLLLEENPDWLIMDRSTLVVLPAYSGEETLFTLVYRTGVFDKGTNVAGNVFTDADTAEIVRVEPVMVSALPDGTGTTSDGRSVQLNTQHTTEIPPIEDGIIIQDLREGFRLMDTTRNLHTVSSGGSSMGMEYLFNPQDDGTINWADWNYSLASHDVIEDDNIWERSPAAVDVHWGMQVAYDYFQNTHGRTGFDGNNGYLRGVVDYDQGLRNAFWFKYMPGVFYGDGGSYGRSMTVLDIVAHEYTHAVESSIVDLNYYEESGALKEGIADIFMTDIKFQNGRNNWSVAPELVGPNVRNLQDPHASEAPDTFEGRFFGEFSTAYERELGLRDLQQHHNSTVLSHWFYLLSEGGEGENDNEDHYDIEPVGRERMVGVVYKSLFMLHPNSTFKDMRDATTSIVQREYGKCSEELKQVTNAWNAVGVGDPYCDCFEGSFTGRFETDDGPAEMKYFFKKDKYAVEVTDSKGNPQVLYTSSTDPYHHVRGYPDIDASTPQGFMMKNMFQRKIPLFASPPPFNTRKEYLEYRNEARTGRTREEGEYTVYEHRMQEATVWSTEEVCLSFADLAGTIGAFGPSGSSGARQMFFGFPTEFTVPGEGSIRVLDIQEHPVSDSYFGGAFLSPSN
ncbi:MAG: M4 family metallopeptidase [Rhodothermales bacterium]|nr:M4 family metallopeptidase [Rhodothermales bacterium]